MPNPVIQTPAERDAERDYIYEERLGMLREAESAQTKPGEIDVPTPGQHEIAFAEADTWIAKILCLTNLPK